MIRPFTADDLDPLHQMICDTIDASYSGVYPVPAIRFFKEYHSKEKIIGRSRTGVVLIAEKEKGGDMVATGSLVENEILGVFVAPDGQGRGYGKAVMGALEDRARAQGLSQVVLDISLPSRRFYESLAYEVLSERSLDVGEGEYLRYFTARKRLT